MVGKAGLGLSSRGRPRDTRGRCESWQPFGVERPGLLAGSLENLEMVGILSSLRWVRGFSLGVDDRTRSTLFFVGGRPAMTKYPGLCGLNNRK